MPWIKYEEYVENYLHLGSGVDAFLQVKCVSNLTGATGRVTRCFSECRREDRYDSVLIEWDHGAKSHYFIDNLIESGNVAFLVPEDRISRFKKRAKL